MEPIIASIGVFYGHSLPKMENRPLQERQSDYHCGAPDSYCRACTRVSEVKIDVVEVVERLKVYQDQECFEVSIYPNPHLSEFSLSVNTFCEGRMEYSLYDHTGKLMRQEAFSSGESLKIRRLQTGDLLAGLYHLVIAQDDAIARYPVIEDTLRRA